MVYVYRNPKDALVSYFHFYNTRSFAPKVPKFEDFFQIFKDDKLPFGNYFDHINGRENRDYFLELSSSVVQASNYPVLDNTKD